MWNNQTLYRYLQTNDIPAVVMSIHKESTSTIKCLLTMIILMSIWLDKYSKDAWGNSIYPNNWSNLSVFLFSQHPVSVSETNQSNGVCAVWYVIIEYQLSIMKVTPSLCSSRQSTLNYPPSAALEWTFIILNDFLTYSII